MDLLIKGMALPAQDTLRLILHPNGRVDTINSYNEAVMPTDAKAIEVLPHGRCIDADKLRYDAETCRETMGAFIELIDEAPTVLEASK